MPLVLRLKPGLKTPFLLFISNCLLNIQRFTRLSAIPLHEIFTSLGQFCVLQKRIKNEILEQYVYFIDMPNTSYIIFHAFTNKEEISINFILDKSFEFFFDQIILDDELRNEILTKLKSVKVKGIYRLEIPKSNTEKILEDILSG